MCKKRTVFSRSVEEQVVRPFVPPVIALHGYLALRVAGCGGGRTRWGWGRAIGVYVDILELDASFEMLQVDQTSWGSSL